LNNLGVLRTTNNSVGSAVTRAWLTSGTLFGDDEKGVMISAVHAFRAFQDWLARVSAIGGQITAAHPVFSDL
jgi:hypothetical protein